MLPCYSWKETKQAHARWNENIVRGSYVEKYISCAAGHVSWLAMDETYKPDKYVRLF